jgi:hypothetical protein
VQAHDVRSDLDANAIGQDHGGARQNPAVTPVMGRNVDTCRVDKAHLLGGVAVDHQAQLFKGLCHVDVVKKHVSHTHPLGVGHG